jgi:adenylate cyclase
MVIKSLKQRLVLLVLLPVALLLLVAGFFGFRYARQSLLDEWQEAAILKLQRAAHYIDMRLGRPISWIEMFYKTAGSRGEFATQEWVLRQIKGSEGVTDVSLRWAGGKSKHRPIVRHGVRMGRRSMMHFHRASISEVTPPRYNTETGQKTVTLISDLKDKTGLTVGRLEVGIRFDYLMQDIIKLGWWQGDRACLVDNSGLYLAHTEDLMDARDKRGGRGDRLELEVLEAMKKRPYGTFLGKGHPPDMVTGFYKIKRAPWAIVLFAPGKRILAPVIRYLIFYVIGEVIALILILFLIRSGVGKMLRSIRDVSIAAGRVAKGNYGDPLRIRSRDEIGQLTRGFNTMVEGLKERDFIRNTFGRYVDQEIAKELLNLPDIDRAHDAISKQDDRSISREAGLAMLNVMYPS